MSIITRRLSSKFFSSALALAVSGVISLAGSAAFADDEVEIVNPSIKHTIRYSPTTTRKPKA